ncbi:MAG: hypothetical protein JWM64_1294 [Frankiales bacterium]|nr:hypothetical protein [Frankiales bacterium]
MIPDLNTDPADLTARRRDAVARFQAARQVAEQAAMSSHRSREMRLDATRRLDVLQRQQKALLTRALEQVERSGELLSNRPRVVLAHSKAWFATSVTGLLRARTVDVVAQLDNGADVVGLAVAEQPDLVLVEDRLAMVPGEEVVRALRQYCPRTLVVAQAAGSERIGVLLDAGAQTVLGAQVRPAEVADRLSELLDA